MEAGDAPIDVGRLSKPEAEAFRYIARALGARFAGDAPEERADARREARPAPRPVQGETGRAPAPSRGSALGAEPSDPRAMAILDRIPAAILVVADEAIVFMNRTALSQFGYPSAAVVDAVGGLGALVRGEGRDGTMTMATAGAATFPARVTMAPVDWDGRQAMLVTVLPATPVPAGGAAGLDALAAFLDANPDPVAIVSQAGGVEACNAAFRALAGGDGGAVVRLSDRIEGDDLRHVLDMIAVAFSLSDGIAHHGRVVRIGEELHRPTVGRLPGGRLACLVLHDASGAGADGQEAAADGPAPEPPPRGDTSAAAERRAEGAPSLRPDGVGSALAAAVREVRRLVSEATVLILTEGDGEHGAAEGGPEHRFLRLLLLSVAARVPAGSVLTVRATAEGYRLELAGGGPEAFASAVSSDRIVELGRDAGLTLSAAHGTLVALRAGGERSHTGQR